MKLHDNQLYLLRHLARFNLLDYQSCLDMLETPEETDRVALSYAFRPLTRNKYISKRKDGSVSILAKGRALFPDTKPLISVGGGAKEARRIIEISRMAALMEKNGIPAVAKLPDNLEPCFIPSACWRNIAPGILSTTRFTGMLVAGDHRLAVYDIGDGAMEWQVRAEGSLFYTRYGSYATKATGMLLICRKDSRIKAARNIIRQTMWNRRQLLQENCVERNKPTQWSRSPIKLRATYEHVYLTTPDQLSVSFQRILDEEKYIQALCTQNGGTRLGRQGIGDIEVWPRHLFVNPACDLLKFVCFFSTVKTYLEPREKDDYCQPQVTLELYIHKIDYPIAGMYPEFYGLEGLKIYAYRS